MTRYRDPTGDKAAWHIDRENERKERAVKKPAMKDSQAQDDARKLIEAIKKL
jgi:hypothetical protein